MTRDKLQSWRKTLPFVIAILCVLPWPMVQQVESGLIEPQYFVAAFLLAFIVAFFYVVLKLREPRWSREKEEGVKAQIRDSLIALIPDDLMITPDELQQLVSTEISKDLSNVFWDTINQHELLRDTKELFYSNGLEYTTEIDFFLLARFFGLCYVSAALVFDKLEMFIIGASLIFLALCTRWFAIPRARREHLRLSREQLELLRRERGDYVSNRFREIVVEWRRTQHPSTAAQTRLRPKHLVLWDVLAVLLVVLTASAGVLNRGWFGNNVRIKSAPEVGSSYINGGAHNEPVAIVFVHGVFGTKQDTWLNLSSGASFPELLATDPAFSHAVDVFVFEYFTPKFGAAPSIVDLADQLRGALDDHRVFEQHKEVVFLAHSMGGVIVRQYLLGNQDRMTKVPMIFFYATPTNGTELAALARLGSANPQLRGMTPIEGNDFLQSVQSGWLNSSKARSIASYCGVEDLPTYGLMVVPRSSATSLCNRGLDPFSANHIEIVKPETRSDPRYTRFASALVKELPSLGTPVTR